MGGVVRGGGQRERASIQSAYSRKKMAMAPPEGSARLHSRSRVQHDGGRKQKEEGSSSEKNCERRRESKAE